MPTEFNDFFSPQTVRLRELPLVHSTSSGVLDALGTNSSLEPKGCPVFAGEKLNYLFYGRACFKPAPRNLPEATTRLEVAPVCFIFRPSVTPLCSRRLFPCDSGAIHFRKFTGIIERDELLAFEMIASCEMAIKLVGFFYDSNQAYVDNENPKAVDLTCAPASVIKYHTLLAREGDTNFDERRSAIEFQCDNPIPLKGNILSVVLPFSLLQRPDIQKRIVEDWQAFPIGYKAKRGVDPDEYYGDLKTVVESALKMGGYL